ETDPKDIAEINKAFKARKPLQITVKNYKKDGTMFWNDLILSPVNNKRGEVTHFIGLRLDVTERIKYQEELEQSQHELASSNKELEQFTYAASHDLQEPLRMVVSYLQLISKRYQGKLDEDADTFINFAVEGAQRMQVLVNDLLLLSRVRTKAKPFKMVNMQQVLDDVLFALQLSITENRVKVTNDNLPSIPADRTQMTQLLQNLIGNAIKYKAPGRDPKIHIGFKDENGNYTFCVKDNGIGIEPAYYERIFGVFQRLHTRQEYEGNGVGLAICHKIVERHDGKIYVESAPGKGSTFYFSLPKKRKDVSSGK
ncbi:MAG TPA: ATP-binding protein, partial [Candidatus Limnocylindrales bacterium]|nr:ATP-binding protein [Candidatus Limnocylindrales bacterium]